MITKELQNKLVTYCQRPRTVVNKYTHESVLVSCGQCPSCILRRSSIQTNLVSSYSAQFRFTYFVTLTYADCFLPTLQVEIVENCTDDIADVSCVPDINSLDVRDNNRYLFGFRSVPRTSSVRLENSTVERTFEDPEVCFSYPMYPKDLLAILDKIKYPIPYRIPYVCNRDLDLFLKRLRSYYPNEKLRYYAVSEYGPTTFRPHWHLLLFSNSERFPQTILENISKAWSYGRYNASLSRGFAAPYVASYVNSFVALPDFYTQMPKVVRPKSFHSIGFTESNLFPGTVQIAEIDVQYVRMCLLHDTRRFYHSVRILAVYLYGYGAFFVTDVQLLFGLADGTYQCVARHKLGVHHIRSETFAHQSESRVGHIFHGGKQYGVLAEVYIFNLHNLTGFVCKSTEKACFICYAGVKSLKEYTVSSLNLYICTIHSLNNRNNYEKEFAFSRIVRDDTAHRHFPCFCTRAE